MLEHLEGFSGEICWQMSRSSAGCGCTPPGPPSEMRPNSRPTAAPGELGSSRSPAKTSAGSGDKMVMSGEIFQNLMMSDKIFQNGIYKYKYNQ